VNKQDQIPIIVSFATIYIVWGSTYLFSAFAVAEIDAFRVCAYRFIPAALICFAIVSLSRGKLVFNKQEWINAAKAGFIFLGLGTGGAIWSLNYLDSGFSALIISAEPLIIVLLIWLFKQTRPARQTLTGIALGIIGMYLLVNQEAMVGGPKQWLGILAIFLSMLAWGSGSIFVSGAPMPKNQFLSTGIQLLVGGLTSIVISIALNEHPVQLSSLSAKALSSMVFLITFGSIGAFTAFNYLLKKVSTEKVVTNTYVNPVIAMLLGYYFNNEIITGRSVLAASIMLFGVFLINSRRVS